MAVWLAGCYDNVEPTTTIHTSLKPHFVSAHFGIDGMCSLGFIIFFFCIVEELFINNHFINDQAYGCMDDLMDVLKITFELLTFTTHLSASFIHS